MSRTLNVDRMRRYRKGRVPSWARSVRGPWPGGLEALVPESVQAELKDFQRRAGIAVDGVIGPQTWVALADANERDWRTFDYLHKRYGTVSDWGVVGGE